MSTRRLGSMLRRWLGSVQRLLSSATCPPVAHRRGLGRLLALEDRSLLNATPLGTETRVNTTTAATQQTSPQTPQAVAILPDGNVVVAWQSQVPNGTDWGIFAQRLGADGSRLGSEIHVNNTTVGNQTSASVAAAGNGTFIVTWTSTQNFGVEDVYARRYQADGTPLGNEFLVNTTTAGKQLAASVAADAAGNFVIAWSSLNQDGSGFGVFAQRFAADGTPQGSEFQVNTFTAWNQQNARVAMNPAGDFVIVWDSAYQDGSGWGIFGQRFAADGTRRGGEFQVNTWTANNQQDSAVAFDSSGNFLVTWASYSQDGDNWGIYAQRFDAAGNAQGSEFQVNVTTAKEQRSPAVAMNGAGDFVITWQSKSQDASGTLGIYARQYSTNNNTLGTEFRVNTTTANDQAYPSAAADSDGFVIVWSGTGPGDGAGIFAQRYQIAGVLVTPTSGLVTSESGGAATFTVVLTSQPTANVTINLSSNNPGEGTSSASSLTFTTANWNIAQTVTVTGTDDNAADGDIAYTIVLNPAVSADPAYNGFDAADVGVTNTDNDTPGITVSPIAGLFTTEAGGTASFTVVLNTVPSQPVTIPIATSNAAEGQVSVSSVTFTALDWKVPQTITITGVDDAIDDGDVAYSIVLGAAVSADPAYNGLDAPDVSVTNRDDDQAGITFIPPLNTITTEAGGTSSFGLVLTSQPTAAVTINLASSDATEGTPSVASLTFTSANWNVAQTVTVTGVDDLVADGDQTYAIQFTSVVSADPSYDGATLTDAALTNQDNDTAGITVAAAPNLTTTETGGTATFTVVLDTMPLLNVIVPVSSSNPAEGQTDVSSLTFTLLNWNVPQTVTITGKNDAVDDGDQAYSIVLGTVQAVDLAYLGKDPADVNVTNRDDDTAGVTVNSGGGLITTTGSTASFQVSLTSEPIAPVTLALTAEVPEAGTLSTATLTFTASDWSAPQTITITGATTTADVTYAVHVGPSASGDANYVGWRSDVSVTNHGTPTAATPAPPTVPEPTSPAPSPPTPVPPTAGPAVPVPVTPQTPHVATATPSQSPVPVSDNRDRAFQFIPTAPAAVDAGSVSALEGANAPTSGNGANKGASFTGAVAALAGAGATTTERVFDSPGAAAAVAQAAQEQRARALIASPEGGTIRSRVTPVGIGEYIPAALELLPPIPLPTGAAAAVTAGTTVNTVSSALSTQLLWEALDAAEERLQAQDSVTEGVALTAAGVVAASSYVLLNTRTGFWLLSLLSARPLWKQFDPLEVLYAWERDRPRTTEEDEESLVSLVE